ncbi:MAG: hypothetical protein J6K22_06850 [Spirochaetaceae bacterium]|nr:hypothetical protein [Spirochaetaceae bacterium]MBQ3024527.1 hypothetical protein [Spirochaetaceae bacterium]
MKKNKILPIAKPIIRGYSYYAHILSMIQNESDSFDWIFSNFIQLHYNTIINNIYWSDFYYTSPHLSMYDICKWLFVRRESKEKILKSRRKLINFIRESLDKNYYIRIDIDHKYIKSFSTNKHPHDALIYGIDGKYVYILDILRNGMYENKKIKYSEFCESAIKCKVITENFMNDCYETYEVIKNNDFIFSIENINNQLLDYYYSSTPEYWKFISAKNQSLKVFGITTYKMLIKILNHIKNNENVKIDIRPFYIFKDHKTMMYSRFEYFNKKQYLNYPRIKELIDNYKFLERMCDTNILLLLKYSKKRNIEIIDLIEMNLNKMFDIEKRTLNNYLFFYDLITEEYDKN